MLVLPFRKTLRLSQWLVVLLLGVLTTTSSQAQTCEDALSGTVYVGDGAGAPAYATFKELYDDINARGLANNLTVLIQSDVVETATAVLNSIANPCDMEDLSISIQPAADEQYLITATQAAVMMHLNGVVNLTIDGSYAGVGTNFIFRHTAANQTVLTLSNGTSHCQVMNSVIESSGASSVAVRIGNASGLAVTNIVFDGNHIRNRSDITQDSNSLHRIGIVSVGVSAAELNEHITITNNIFSGFSQSGIDIGKQTSIASAGNYEYYLGGSAFNGLNNGSYFTISNNRLYAPITLSLGHVCVPIKFNPGVSSRYNVISGNVVGGSNATNEGTLTYNSDNGFSAIYVSVGGTTDEEATVISDNVVHNIHLNRTGQTWQRFAGIETFGSGSVKILNNTVGSLTQNNSILVASNGFNNNQFMSFVYGIWHCSTGNAEIDGNIVSNMNSVAATGITMTTGIRVGTRENYSSVAPTTLTIIIAGHAKINNNIVANLTTPARGWRFSSTSNAPVHPGALCGIVLISNAEDNEVMNNQVYNLHNTVAGINHRSTSVIAIAVDGSGPAGHDATGIISGNTIYNINNYHQNNGNINDRPEVIGIAMGTMIAGTAAGTTQGRGSYEIANNMISLAPVVPANSTTVVGIMDQIQGPSSTKVYNNTVYIGGSGINSLHPTAAYLKFPNRYRAGLTDGASQVYNNIFINERTGMTNSYAMAGLINGTPNYQGNYNFLSSASGAQMTSWQNAPGSLGAWRTATGGNDLNSSSAAITTGNSTTTTINPSELFEDKLNDLHLQLTPEELFPHAFVYGMGQPMPSVANDIDDEERHAEYPCQGADEIELPCTELEMLTDLPAVHMGCYDNNTTLYVQIDGSYPRFITWEVSTNGGVTWTTIANAGKYSGAKTTALTINNTTANMIGFQYRITVRNMCSNVSSAIATLDLQVCPANDNPSNTNPNLSNNSYVYPNNIQVSGTTLNATINMATGTRDVWYRIIPISNGVTIKVSSTVIDPVLYLFDSNNMSTPIDVENLITGTGTEIMNVTGLTEGHVYRLAVASATEVDGEFKLVVQHLRKPQCSVNTNVSLCEMLSTSITGANTVTYEFTDVNTNVTTSYTAPGYNMLASTPAAQLRYGATYNAQYTANYQLQNGLGETETIVVPNTQTCNITIGAHREAVVKVNNRCTSGSVHSRTGYLTGEYTGSGGICTITGFDFEFTPVANCAGDDPQPLDKFSKAILSTNIYISLNYAFNHMPLASNPQLGYWSVRIRPRFNGYSGVYGQPFVIAVNGTAPAVSMALNDAPVANAVTSSASAMDANIYPNPNNGELVNLNITGITSNEVYVRVMDSMGREVYTNRYAVDGSLNTMVNFGQSLAQGVYMVEMRAGEVVKTQRMMVTK
jgi:hypothetical protein